MTELFGDLPPLPGGRTDPPYDCGDGAVLQLCRGVDRAALDAFCAALTAGGWEERGGCAYGNARGGDYVRGDRLLHLVWDGDLRVTVDPNAVLPPQTDACPRTVQPELYQFETDHSLIDCGMCYIFRCADGSFFLIDSAHFYSMNDDLRLHRFLRALTPDGEPIRIAGWYFTHGHSDHVCKFMDFLQYRCDDAVIERVYANFPTVDHRDSGEWSASEKAEMTRFRTLLAERPAIPVCKVRALQRFAVRNLTATVLCTHEDVYPLSCEDFNETTCVLRVEAEGNVILFPGDACREESDILTARYPDGLDCDILQLAHHGHTGCRSDFYRRANARVLLVPNTRIKYEEERPRRPENTVAESLAREVYLSAEGTVGLPLPYEEGAAERFPDETTEDFQGVYDLWGYAYDEAFKQRVREDFEKRR
ncbi:MAG: hypothetical protein II738_03160 [Clostridia bacterium]|nr:hypothetical protein [Clostridia bacterium]